MQSPTPNNERVGMRWTKEEERTLLTQLTMNMSVEDIANQHKRYVGGIAARIRKIAYDMYKQNVDITIIMDITKLTKEQIDEVIANKGVESSSNKSSITNQLTEINQTLKEILQVLSSSNKQISVTVDNEHSTLNDDSDSDSDLVHC